MSKYIRTKDGEIIDTEKYGNLVHNSLGYITYLGAVMIKEKDIDREADTIEELCDELVVCDPQLLLPFTRERIGGDLYLHPSFEEKFKEGKLEAVYGAIWTKKGLIYVAQMNEKGELELL